MECSIGMAEAPEIGPGNARALTGTRLKSLQSMPQSAAPQGKPYVILSSSPLSFPASLPHRPAGPGGATANESLALLATGRLPDLGFDRVFQVPERHPFS